MKVLKPCLDHRRWSPNPEPPESLPQLREGQTAAALMIGVHSEDVHGELDEFRILNNGTGVRCQWGGERPPRCQPLGHGELFVLHVHKAQLLGRCSHPAFGLGRQLARAVITGLRRWRIVLHRCTFLSAQREAGRDGWQFGRSETVYRNPSYGLRRRARVVPVTSIAARVRARCGITWS